MLPEAGIVSKSLCFWFLNEILAHPWSEEGPGITRIGCTKGPKMLSEVGIDPQLLCYGFPKEIMDLPC